MSNMHAVVVLVWASVTVVWGQQQQQFWRPDLMFPIDNGRLMQAADGQPPAGGPPGMPPPGFPPQASGPQRAIARLINSNTVSGVIVFIRLPSGSGSTSESVRIMGNVTGLVPNSIHGFHIHEFGDISGPTGCLGAGPHFNPKTTSHGAPTDVSTNRHDGDLGNIVADQNGVVNLDAAYDFVHLAGPAAVIGRAVVVHEKMDDLGRGAGDSKTTGNAGGRLVCGVIVTSAALGR